MIGHEDGTDTEQLTGRFMGDRYLRFRTKEPDASASGCREMNKAEFSTKQKSTPG